MPPTDGSSVISESKRANVSVRDGGLCVLCGDDPIDVAHIVARKSGDIGQVSRNFLFVGDYMCILVYRSHSFIVYPHRSLDSERTIILTLSVVSVNSLPFKVLIICA